MSDINKDKNIEINKDGSLKQWPWLKAKIFKGYKEELIDKIKDENEKNPNKN